MASQEKGGFAEGVSGIFRDQRQSALELKMKSTLMEQEMSRGQQIEREKYERENRITPESLGALDALFQKGGLGKVPLNPGMNQEEFKTLAGMGSHLIQTRQQTAIVDNRDEYDPISGLKIGTDKINALGATVGKMAYKPFAAQLERWKVLGGSLDRLNELKGMYDNLNESLTGPVGGRIGNVLGSVGLSEANVKMRKALKEASPLIALGLSKIPGGRFSVALGKQISGGLFDPTTQRGVMRDIFDNSQFQLYLEMKQMGSKAPTYLEEKFYQVPKNANGVPDNVAFVNGRMMTPKELNDFDIEFTVGGWRSRAKGAAGSKKSYNDVDRISAIRAAAGKPAKIKAKQEDRNDPGGARMVLPVPDSSAPDQGTENETYQMPVEPDQ